MCHACRWITPRPDLDLRPGSGSAAGLMVQTPGGTEFWLVAPERNGYRVTEDLGNGRLGRSYTIDASFGDRLEHWECSCNGFRHRTGRGNVRHGCLHCRAVHAAVKKAGV